MDSELETKKQPKTPAERARAYRQRKKQNKPLTAAENIQILESKLRDPNCSPREATALTRRINLLKGIETPYDRRPVAERKPIAPPPEPDALPNWWTEEWARYHVCCRVWAESPSSSHWTAELDRCESDWATSEGLTVEELREQIRREHSERMAQHFPNGYPRSTAEWAEWNKQHPDQYEESQRRLRQQPSAVQNLEISK